MSPAPAEPRRPIVVGYNGRKHSREALLWAAAEAVRRDLPLLVLYGANYPGMTLGSGPGLLEHEPGALDAAQAVTLRGVSEALVAHPELEVSGVTEVTGPVQALTEASDEAALVVVGTREYGRVAGALLGSVAFAVAAQARCPVIVVPRDPSTRPVGPEHGVVVGTDGSPQAAAAVDFAAGVASAASAPLEVITCTGEHPDVDAAVVHDPAAAIAGAAVDRLRASHPELIVTAHVEDGPAERALVDRSVDAGLVVVGTRGRGAFSAMLLGSVSHAVISGAHSLVAVVEDDPR